MAAGRNVCQQKRTAETSESVVIVCSFILVLWALHDVFLCLLIFSYNPQNEILLRPLFVINVRFIPTNYLFLCIMTSHTSFCVNNQENQTLFSDCNKIIVALISSCLNCVKNIFHALYYEGRRLLNMPSLPAISSPNRMRLDTHGKCLYECV